MKSIFYPFFPRKDPGSTNGAKITELFSRTEPAASIAPRSNIQQVFLYHGALITFGGMLLGDFIGLLICWLQDRFGFITLPEDSYFISKAAVRINWQQVCLVNLGTFVVCFVVLLIPSFFIIRRLSPVRAISFN